MSQDQTPPPEPSPDESPATPTEPEAVVDLPADSLAEAENLPEPDEPEAGLTSTPTSSDLSGDRGSGTESSPETSAATTAAATPPSVPSASSARTTVKPEALSPSETLKDIWSQTKPALKVQTIQFLKWTIRVLEGVVAKLEAPPPEPVQPAVAGEATVPAAPADWVRQLQVNWQRLAGWWTGLLRQIRPRLPAVMNQRLDDRALTATIGLLLVLGVWTTSSLLSGKPQPTEVATAPAPPPEPVTIPIAEPTLPPVLKAPEPQQQVAEKPDQASPLPEQQPAPSENKPAPPAPPLRLTPEQKLIASIQDEVSDVSKQYVEGLIESVQANFRSSRLIVRISNQWYVLNQSQQDKLSNELLKRAQELDFSKLELVDPEETLLARSPVVGSEMVILRRSNEPEATV